MAQLELVGYHSTSWISRTEALTYFGQEYGDFSAIVMYAEAHFLYFSDDWRMVFNFNN